MLRVLIRLPEGEDSAGLGLDERNINRGDGGEAICR